MRLKEVIHYRLESKCINFTKIILMTLPFYIGFISKYNFIPDPA